MYPSTSLPKPLSVNVFYILLFLARQESHGYAIKGAAANDSLGSVQISEGTLYKVLFKLVQAGLVESRGSDGSVGKIRALYGITNKGAFALENELKRMKHAVAIGESAGYLSEDIPQDIRELLEDLR